jgi:hypothetical protein
MGTERPNRVTVSPSARAKCIKRARKTVRLQEKWGFRLALLYLVLGILGLGLSIGFVIVFQRFLRMEGFRAQAVQDLAWMGYLLGLSFGTLASVTAYSGIIHIVEGMKFLAGNPASYIIVEYDDALVNMMHEQDRSMSSECDTRTPQDSPSSTEANA